MWSNREREYFFDKGCEIDKDGIVKVPRIVWSKQIYRGVDAETGVKNWMIPSEHGCCLIFEHRHFEIV